ncbi:hypothetical protein [Vogesella alkaliphila]|uniref:CHAT domain-containing protein n=1 Tax=Vogesella alkaliphila TaxID=1193621 RepID=A0ABQ2YIK9_9NEIS|nr:hypothetical protein [Vogesella alkaliphila]GGX85494.1 hypothetical protein GCM10011290_11420 [Vogesella alkaliphila]
MRISLLDLKNLFDTHFETGINQEEELLTLLTSTIAQLNAMEIETFRSAHAQLSQILHEQGTRCLPFLISIFEENFKLVHRLILDTPATEQDSTLGQDDFLNLYKHCLALQPKHEMRILSFQLPDIKPWSAKDVRPWIKEFLNDAALVPLDEKNLRGDISAIAAALGISRSLNRETIFIYETYCQFGAFLERLSLDGYHQLARDNAEEAMVCAHTDGCQEYGHYCRFSLATMQKNPIDAALHACLLVSSLKAKTSIPTYFYYRLLSAAFSFYRDFGFIDLAVHIYDKINSLEDLNDYDRQKTAMAYFNLLLISNPLNALKAANVYATEHLEKIKAYREASAVPWLALICNLKAFFPDRFSNQTTLVELEKHIDNILPIEQAESLRDRILPMRPNAKKYVIDLLDKLHQTRNKADHIFEVNLLQATASRLLETSLNNGDIEGILLSHQVKSDGGLAFELSEKLPRHTLLRHDDTSLSLAKGKSSQYIGKVEQLLAQHPTIRYLWLGFEGDRVYYLLYDNGHFISNGYIPGCSKTQINAWLKNDLPNLAFNDSPPNQGPFMTREDIWRDESEKIRKQLPKLSLPNSDKKTLVLCDIDMACFPHNLLVELTDDSPSQALCNPLSLDHLLNCTPSKIDASKISVWAPLTENDNAIHLAHSRLMDHLDDCDVTYADGLLPTFEHQTDIKVFICHGGRAESGGFTGLYPSNNKKYTSTDILGSGKVAILFVCHGGHVNTDLYARSFQTLAKTLLMSGYEAVIAPAWSLNVVIPGPWIEVFLEKIRSGENIVDATLHANHRIKDLFPLESAWAALHLFGNPHLSGHEV